MVYCEDPACEHLNFPAHLSFMLLRKIKQTLAKKSLGTALASQSVEQFCLGRIKNQNFLNFLPDIHNFPD